MVQIFGLVHGPIQPDWRASVHCQITADKRIALAGVFEEKALDHEHLHFVCLCGTMCCVSYVHTLHAVGLNERTVICIAMCTRHRQLEAMSHMSLSHVAVHIKTLFSTVFFIRFIVLPFTRTSVFYLVGDILVILFPHLVE